jgi:macrolide-specific efflux system membrane fusion protein
MSSSDRAALLDMARAKGDAELKYWEDVYKSTPIVAPVNGLIINRNVVEGQTVASSTDLYDMSDRLIVLAAVDETDLGSIRLGQLADVTVDAYPNDSFPCKVIMITHEAVKVNNVVSYYVKLAATKAPAELRAGMTANINFRVNQYLNALLLPSWAVKGAQQSTVNLMVKKAGDAKDAKPQQASVSLGDTDGSQVVVLTGLNEGDSVVVSSLSLPDASASTSLFGGPPRAGSKATGSSSKGH